MELWLCDLTHDNEIIASDTMPTNIGYIASYLKSNSKYHPLKQLMFENDRIGYYDNTGKDIVARQHFLPTKLQQSGLCYMYAIFLKRMKNTSPMLY